MSGSGTQDATQSANRQELRVGIIEPVNEFANRTSGKNPRTEMIFLKSCEGVKFMVPLAVAAQSDLVRYKVHMWSEFESSLQLVEPLWVKPLPTVSLPDVTAPVVEHMVSFWTEHFGSDNFTKEREEEVRNWEKKFFDKMDKDQLVDLVFAAHSVEAKEMFDRVHKYISQLPIKFPISRMRVV